MNVLFLLNSTFPYYSGGRENWLFNVSDHLIERGHGVYAMVIRPGRHATQHYEPDPRFKLIPVTVPFYHGIGARVLRGPLSLIKFGLVVNSFISTLDRICELIFNLKAIVTLDTVVTPLAVSPAIRSRFPFICANKGPHAEVMAQRFPLMKPLFFKLEKRAYSLADEVWANGFDMQDYIMRQGYSSVMVGNGIDIARWDAVVPMPSEYRTATNHKRLVSIGTVLPIKGVVEAIKALTQLHNILGMDFELVWVGKGNPSAYLAIADSLGVVDRVRFLGARKDVRPYAKHADILLCLSGGGGLSMAALEGMASSVPVVAWDTPVYRQIITDGESGFLAPYKDIDGLAAVIKQAANLSEAKKESITKKAREVAYSHDWDEVVSRIEERLERLSK